MITVLLILFALVAGATITGFIAQWVVFGLIERAGGKLPGAVDTLFAFAIGFAHAYVWYSLVPDPVTAVIAGIVAVLSPVYIRLARPGVPARF